MISRVNFPRFCDDFGVHRVVNLFHVLVFATVPTVRVWRYFCIRQFVLWVFVTGFSFTLVWPFSDVCRTHSVSNYTRRVFISGGLIVEFGRTFLCCQVTVLRGGATGSLRKFVLFDLVCYFSSVFSEGVYASFLSVFGDKKFYTLVFLKSFEGS